mgnify:CR=1 FL=1
MQLLGFRLHQSNFLNFVPQRGLEPLRPQWSLDFKSSMTTDSITEATLLTFVFSVYEPYVQCADC